MAAVPMEFLLQPRRVHAKPTQQSAGNSRSLGVSAAPARLKVP